MYLESTIPIKSNSISVYIARRLGEEVQLLLVNRLNAAEDDWGIIHTDVKPMEMCWQAALSQVRLDTSLVPDSVYSVDKVEISYDVKTHAVMLAPTFLAMFDHGQEVTPLDPDIRVMWLSVDQAMRNLPLASQREMVKMLHENYFLKEPCSKLKVYPTRF